MAGAVPGDQEPPEGLAGNRIRSLAGIINGTANFILTGMQSGHGRSPRCSPRRRSADTPKPTPPRRRRNRCGAQTHHPRVHRVRPSSPVRPGIRGGSARGRAGGHFLRGPARLPNQASRPRPPHEPGHRDAGASDHGAEAAAARLRGRGHERGPHRGGCGGADRLPRSGRRGGADRIVRRCGPRGRGPDPDHRSGVAGSAPRLSSRPPGGAAGARDGGGDRLLSADAAEDRPGVLAELASIFGRLDISIEAVSSASRRAGCAKCTSSCSPTGYGRRA